MYSRTILLQRLIYVLCGSACAAALLGVASTAPRIANVGAMSVERAAHQAIRLSGGVLITGGCGGESCATVYRSTEIFDPERGRFRSTAPMTIARASHALARLPDGRVLIAGGWTGTGSTAATEIYDPTTGRFSRAADLSGPRIHPVAVVLQDGRVLITGGEVRTGQSLDTAEVFDPKTETFTPVGRMTDARMNHTATPLEDGRVFIAGGQRARGEILSSAEIFDPATNRFTAVGNMISPRTKHAAVRLADDRILIVSGSDARGFKGRYASTEIFDPSTRTFSDGPRLSYTRHKIPDAVVVLSSGDVLVLGGARHPEILRAGAQEFAGIDGELPADLMFATATVLPSKGVLVVGGYDERIRSHAGAWMIHCVELPRACAPL